ncbi:MAG: hypothetical protein IKX57_03995 [Oscillospiraceae bacterium]|nr:hypothetical protein [Oscillospiraceae bacterium]
MKTTELMRAMEEARPDMLEAAAPSVSGSGSKPDLSGVLSKIRGGQPETEVRVPAVTIRQTKRPRLITAMLTACSVAACAAVVTGLAFLIRNTGDTVEMSSNVAVQFASETAPDNAAEQVTGQPAVTTVPGNPASAVQLPFLDTKPVTHTVTYIAGQTTAARSNAVPVADAQNTDPAADQTDAVPQTTAKPEKDVPKTTAPPEETDPPKPVTKDALTKITLLEITIPDNISGEFRFEISDGAVRLDAPKLIPEKECGVFVLALIRTGVSDDEFTLYLVNDKNGKRATAGTYRWDRHDIVTPLNADMEKAFLTTGSEPEPYVPALKTLPAPSFIYQWNSDQYQTFDTALHHESAAAWKNRRMADGDRALYADDSDGFLWLDKHADSAHYLWFMYEADGYVPEVRRVEITENGIRIEAVLVPADVQGKVRVMIPLNVETPASWFADSADQWQLSISGTISRATEKPADVNWNWDVD